MKEFCRRDLGFRCSVAWAVLALVAPCYLVTNKRIDEIPCNLRAATTDALRYKAKEREPVTGGSNQEQQVKRAEVSHLGEFGKRRRQRTPSDE